MLALDNCNPCFGDAGRGAEVAGCYLGEDLEPFSFGLLNYLNAVFHAQAGTANKRSRARRSPQKGLGLCVFAPALSREAGTDSGKGRQCFILRA